MGFVPFSLDRLRAQYVHDEAYNEAARIKAPVESIGKSSQVVLAVRAVPQRAEHACQCRFQTAKHGIDPLELRQVARLEITHHRGQVNTTRIGHCGEAPQAVAGHAGNAHQGHQARPDLFGGGLGRETADQMSLTYSGELSSSTEAAATEGALFSDPRPALPPARSPAR
jgi:hypothetical protein